MTKTRNPVTSNAVDVMSLGIAEVAAKAPRSSVISLVRERRWPLVVWAAMLGWSAVLFVFVRSHFLEFRLQRYDLGNMVQAVWSTAHGRPLEMTLGTGEQVERLATHVDPILVLLAPLWILAPSPLTLAAVQIGACALGALPVFWLGRHHLDSERAAALLALAYLAYPWLIWTALDAMHPVTFAIPLFLFAIWFLESKRVWAFSLCALLILATGELMGLSLAALGIWFWLSRGQRCGLLIAGAGVAWTLLCIKVIVPAFRGGESPFYAYFAPLGGSPEGVLRTAFTHPGAIVEAMFTGRDILYVLALAAPLCGAFLLAPGLATVALPQLAANGLSSIDGTTDPRGHHIAGVIPFLVAALILGLARLPTSRRVPVAAAVLVASATFSWLNGPWPGVPWLHGRMAVKRTEALREAVSLVPDGAPASATSKAGSHLSARRYFFSFPLIADAEWVVVDVYNSWIPRPPRSQHRATWGTYDPALLRATIARLEASSDWRKAFERRGIFVFQRVQVRSED